MHNVGNWPCRINTLATGRRRRAGDSAERNHVVPLQEATVGISEAVGSAGDEADSASEVVDSAREATNPASDVTNSASKNVDSERDADAVKTTLDVTKRTCEVAGRKPDAAKKKWDKPKDGRLPVCARKPAEEGRALKVMTWNACGLMKPGRELALLHLLASADVDAATITETEIPSTVINFAGHGYTTILPIVPAGGKTRVVVLV
jgi:hypothetical protein